MTVVLGLVAGIMPTLSGPSTTRAASPSAPAMPLSAPTLVVANAGQFDPTVQFQIIGNDGTLWLTNDGLWLMPRPATSAAPASPHRLEFAGMSDSFVVEPFGPLATRLNYLIGDDAGRWRTDLPTWSGLRLRQVAPGTDLEIGDQDGRLAWRWLSAQPASALPTLASTGSSAPAISAPTLAAAATPLLPASLRADVAASGINPASTTLIGGSFTDNLYGLAVDHTTGSAVIVGSTFSYNFPVTPGARDTNWDNGLDMFVAKFSPGGDALLFATYLGGGADDTARAVTMDAANNVLIAGSTASRNFPRTLGTLVGSSQAVFARLSPTGTTLLASHLFGGGGSDEALALSHDSASGLTTLAGTTSSADFPTTSGALQTARRGTTDAFVTRHDASGGLLYGTYVGGTGTDEATALVAVGSTTVYLAGNTTSSSQLATTGAAQSKLGGGSDGFVAALSPIGPGGTALAYATYLGGSGTDQIAGLAIDARGAAYVTGSTTSRNFPTTSGVLQSDLAGAPSPAPAQADAFVTKINPNGSRLVYSTYHGGSGADGGGAVLVDASGVVTLTGRTNSTNFPITADATQSTSGGAYDVFVSRLTALGTAQLFGTYLGGVGDDYGRALATHGTDLLLGGLAGSLNFPTTPGAYQRANRGDSEAFVSRLPLGAAPIGPLPTSIDDGTAAVGTTTLATTWYFAEGFTDVGFDEYLTIFNPGATPGTATITYYLEGATPVVRSVPLRASGRTLVTVHEPFSATHPGGLGRFTVGHGTRVETDLPVAVERPMYFESGAYAGSHTGRGATALNSRWYFAEGYTGTGFDEYLTLLNPSAADVPVRITYYLDGTTPVVVNDTIPANRRLTIAVHETTKGVGRGKAVSALVESTNGQGIVAERPMYFTYANGASGGHTILGANAPGVVWNFAEGYTGGAFDQYLTIQNPAAVEAQVQITYFLSDGQAPVVRTFPVQAASRATVTVHADVNATTNPGGLGRNQAVSTRVETTNGVGIVVERPMYFSYSGQVNGGHDVLGVAAPAATWYLADGNTTSDYDEYLTIMNPGAVPGTATITYYVDGESGARAPLSVALPANSRTTVRVFDAASDGGLGRLTVAHATVISADVAVVVERPMYFVYHTSFQPTT